MVTGILGAMREEVAAILREVRNPRAATRAGRDFVSGELHGRPVVVVFSRWGKVAAASTTTELILSHGVDRVVFLGIAGGLQVVSIGDIVVARDLYQHDLDASPFFEPTEVPLLGRKAIPADQRLSAELLVAAQSFLQNDLRTACGRSGHAAAFDRLGLSGAKAVRADIASGDQVIVDEVARAVVLGRVPTAAAVDMESAAAAQVCFEHGVPFACVRTISDSADAHAPEAVKPFFEGLAGEYAAGVVGRWK